MTAPTYYAAHRIDQGAMAPVPGYLGRCGLPGCTYWADHPTDLAQVVDAIAGHRAREHEDAEPHDRPSTLLDRLAASTDPRERERRGVAPIDRLGQAMAESRGRNTGLRWQGPDTSPGGGDAAATDVSPGVLTFGEAAQRGEYGEQGPAALARSIRRADRADSFENGATDRRPSPYPRDRQQEPYPGEGDG